MDDPNLEITTFRELAPTVNVAFKRALKSRLGDAAFVEKLTDQNASSRPVRPWDAHSNPRDPLPCCPSLRGARARLP